MILIFLLFQFIYNKITLKQSDCTNAIYLSIINCLIRIYTIFLSNFLYFYRPYIDFLNLYLSFMYVLS